MKGVSPHAELHPDVVAEAKRLRRASPKSGDRLSFRQISAKLAEFEFLNEHGRPYNPKSIRAMVVTEASRPSLSAAFVKLPKAPTATNAVSCSNPPASNNSCINCTSIMHRGPITTIRTSRG